MSVFKQAIRDVNRIRMNRLLLQMRTAGALVRVTRHRIYSANAVLVIGLVLFLNSGCTINVYHANLEPAERDLPLVVPEIVPESACSNICGGSDARIISAKDKPVLSVLEMNADRTPGNASYRVGDSVVLKVRPSVDAYIHCYYQMANKDIIKIFPNQQNVKAWLYSGQLMAIPKRAAFKIVPDTKESSEAFLCLAASEDLSGKLPNQFRESLLEPLAVYSFDEIYRVYRNSTVGNLVGRVISIDIL